MKKCRECNHEVSEQAMTCPHCGAPRPAKPDWDGWGFEYKSKIKLMDIPLLHISFKYRPNRFPVPARGIIAIGQFAFGFFTLSQFGIGVISVSQITHHHCRLCACPDWRGLFTDRSNRFLHSRRTRPGGEKFVGSAGNFLRVNADKNELTAKALRH